MAAEVRDAIQILQILEHRRLPASITAAIEHVVKGVYDAAQEIGVAKGEVNIKLKFEGEGSQVEVRTEITEKLPKVPRPTSMFFVNKSGQLSLEHPLQTSMFDKPTEVKKTDAAE